MINEMRYIPGSRRNRSMPVQCWHLVIILPDSVCIKASDTVAEKPI